MNEMNDEELEELANSLVDLGMAGVEGLAGRIISGFPEIPFPAAAESMVKVVLAEHLGEGVMDAFTLLGGYIHLLSDANTT